ncbi:MAG: hypothetical protein KAJ17_02675 [Candidatus Krumholzibacteria bacterium]|nr:hypothetical protein [Candidatus Krumholzibacteria bacterium]
MKKPFVVAALVALVAVAAIHDLAKSQQGYKSIQLVYHSDTRGYYRPCG